MSDGLVINIIRGEGDNYKSIQSHSTILNDNRVVVIYPKEYSDYNSEIRQLMAVDSLLSDNSFINDNPFFFIVELTVSLPLHLCSFS